MIDRRTVIRMAALAGVSPAFAAPISPPLATGANLSRSSGAAGTDTERITLKIKGWENSGDGASYNRNGRSVETAQEAWIRVDRSWRAAWR
jgi:hypothetical protein